MAYQLENGGVNRLWVCCTTLSVFVAVSCGCCGLALCSDPGQSVVQEMLLQDGSGALRNSSAEHVCESAMCPKCVTTRRWTH